MSEMIGRNLGPYRIMQQIGMGGMATVYKAYQANVDRNVAVKVLPRHFAQDPTFVGRFEQEAKVIANLEHARILPVYDYGEDDGITYIVMRYLDAGTLSERIRAGAIPLPEVARIIGQISEGLDYAHKKGVIHRDIKPSNIMLDSNGDVYITDFGISKLIEGTAQFTGSGIVGTPDYVSPEQGLGQPIDSRSDIYSLGIVLYQMATQDVPFHAETPMAVIIKHIHDPLPLPRSINPELSESVENVILKTLSKNPEDRYQTCGAMAKALTAAVGGAHVPMPEMSPSTLPTAIPQSTRPVAAPGDAGTIPMAPPPAASEETKVTDKKRSGCLTPLIIVGVLVGVLLMIFLVVGVLRGIRNRQSAQSATNAPGVAATLTPAPQLAAAPPVVATSNAGVAEPGSAPVGPLPSAGAPTENVIFEDHFATQSLSPTWQWLNEPQKQWNTGGGHLSIGVLPNTRIANGQGLTYKLGAPALVVAVPADLPPGVHYSLSTVLAVTPQHNFQMAGLIVLSERNQPLFSLTRAMCSTPPPSCSGDALYLDDWRAFATGASGYHARQAAGGTLPPNGPIGLRINVETGRVWGEYSLDGGHVWNLVGDWPVGPATRVGFAGLVTASGGTDSPPIPARFDAATLVLTSPPQ